MYELEFSPSCRESISKKCRKDKALEEALWKKISQILENPRAFKPLRAPLEGRWRVHVGSFVLIYKIAEEKKTVWLLKFSHHDEAYRS
jgi:mRNA-degrading endonuclease RelE of RelBE toxin-antitoxin system